MKFCHSSAMRVLIYTHQVIYKSQSELVNTFGNLNKIKLKVALQLTQSDVKEVRTHKLN